MLLVNWNVEWATPRSNRRSEILRRIELLAPEVVCLTETDIRLLGDNGHSIYSQPDPVQTIETRRKVLLWSREPWRQVDDVGAEGMPPGRFVSAVTSTSVGELTVIGVCIPWHGSRTRYTGDSVRRGAWEDHQQLLGLLPQVLERVGRRRVIMVGDFNQQVGQRGYAPGHIRDALKAAMSAWLTLATPVLGFAGRRTIDHIALSEDLSAESLGTISNVHEGRKLSDHFGVFAQVSAPSPLVPTTV